MLPGQMTKTRSLEKIWADIWVRGSENAKKWDLDKKVPSKSSKNHWLDNVLAHREKLTTIPYKTCRLLILLEPLSQKYHKKYQKSIRFFSKS